MPRVKHGMADTPTYNSWKSMVSRCNDKRCASYQAYGGSGISVCDEWMSFERFFEDTGKRPEGMSIDRIDNSLGYSKENCKWSSVKEQNINRKSSRFIEFNGETKTMQEWADQFGLSKERLFQRLKSGWDICSALTTPLANKGPRANFGA